ncbi:polyketide cyclase/dehydrase/lipid transport protein [Pseudonocardia sediminis]|uniref:Polyketide cyclase/dehydrase/lipid transport protein n=1 Tax=Pseudonocardia sediminis TaxID=1397368 RepID=A0A4Q7V2V0_PSEST|nr:SRPBCC family protein [Pseudonocardia sediminis]RZT88902.1 polyketide cyclase/dehydrase/lipid transport protein [Pseudonocardia sediminis]
MSRHISTVIGTDPAAVYAFASDPENLPRWAAGLSGSVEYVDGRWRAESPMGTVTVTFAPANEWGVLDHDVELPSGEVTHNPLRVTAHPDGAEIVFSLRRADGVADTEFERDAATVTADLARLKQLLEA